MAEVCSFDPKDIVGAWERLEILKKFKTIAMVGLSADPYRPSYFAAIYMKTEGYRIIPVNPKYKEVLGEKCYPDLKSISEPVEIVDIFRKSQDVPPIVDDAVSIGAKVVWMQLGVVNAYAAERALKAGLQVVMDRCVKIEHARFFGGLHVIGLNTGVITSKRGIV